MSMNHRYYFEAINKSLRDILANNLCIKNKLYGEKILFKKRI